MIQILLVWLAQFLILLGVGEVFLSLVARRWWPGGTWLHSGAARFWTGTVLLFIFLEFWHLFRPIHAACWVIVSGVGALGCVILFRHWKRERIPPAVRPASPETSGSALGRYGLPVLLLLLCAFVAAWRIAGCPATQLPWDTNMYHLSLLRWMNEYSAVPGLANLQSRFGFNTGFLRYAALWNIGPFEGRAAWITPCFFELAALGQLLLLLFQPRAPLAARSFALLTLPFFLYPVFTATASLYYDSFSQTAIVILIATSLRAWSETESRPTAQQPRFFLVCCLAALAFAGKPVGAMTLFFVSVAGALVLWVSFRRNGLPVWQPVFRCLLLPALLVAGYFAIGAIVSGWPLYPLPLFKIPGDWAVPADEVEKLYAVIKAHARLPGPAMPEAMKGFWHWFPSWEAEQFRPAPESRLLLLSLLVLPAYIWCRFGTPWNRRRWLELALLGLATLNLAFWFVSAPSLRFGSAFFWCLVALLTGFFLEAVFRRPRVVLGVGLLATGFWCANLDWLPFRASHAWEIPKVLSRSTRRFIVPNGQSPRLVVHVPKGWAATVSALGDCPLPGSPEIPSSRLHWRVPGKLRKGFKIVPSSQPQD